MAAGTCRAGTRCGSCGQGLQLGTFLSQLEEKPPCPAWAWDDDPEGKATLLHRCPGCGAATLVTAEQLASLVVEWQLRQVLVSVSEAVRRGEAVN